MAAALARGIAYVRPGEQLVFTDSGSGRAQALATELSGGRAENLGELLDADAIVLAVKPKALASVAPELALFEGPVISLLGATPLSALAEALPGADLLRTMPNVGVEVGRGVICHAPAPEGAAMAAALDVLGSIATLVELPEEQLDLATAVMGCSPAYIARACGAIADAGAAAGMDRELALRLVSLTAAGTGDLLLRHDPEEIQKAVASPGGSTEAGLEAMAEHEADAAFAGAVRASLERMEGKR